MPARPLLARGARITRSRRRGSPASPLAGGPEGWSHASLPAVAGAISGADAILIASPVYNYDVNAAAKNLIELTGRSFTGKVVGFLLAAGGRSAYMAPIGFAASLMLDFRCLIVPRFVSAVLTDFDGNAIANPDVAARVADLCPTTLRLTRALAPPAAGATPAPST